MENIAGFFGKFRNKIVSEIQNRDFIIETIKKHTKASLDIDNIKISNGIIRLETSQVVKNEVFIKKDRILKDINKKIFGIQIVDIK